MNTEYYKSPKEERTQGLKTTTENVLEDRERRICCLQLKARFLK